MNDIWAAIGAVSAAVGALVVVVGALYARSQVDEARLSRNASLLLEFRRQYHSLETREFGRRLVLGEFGDPDTFDPEALDPADHFKFHMLIDQLDFLGMLVERRLIDFELVLAAFHSSPPQVWSAVGPHVYRVRKRRSAIYGAYFERLVEKYEKEIGSHTARLTQAGRRG